ncbi:hypothetical protein CAS74_002278 [Pichia kudriavzevii]|uniref:Uncharacterized protein n=1 Tax=Pichia kudriavzevii TaxID=4909 RepID=A0A099P2J9_PICKU|nr:uncharacterized protein C5L36_0D03030 [Pichia kudriavzevii]AWU77564.1 hypothetical protein C5L36_0D03030 [Pichia kudriavzevii]KGK38397.1 hypothetical protein JL09_g2458 [Pichia kudriavzevii]ONH74593.1 hypothetical protein BOH78_2293 [Pichia kudriavzevii]OUT22537.1 hypothetical protein CAS74_002278 [Pichia kudriavzevii]
MEALDNTHRELLTRFRHFINNGKLKLPERLRHEEIAKDDVYERARKLYEVRPQQREEDEAILKLIGYSNCMYSKYISLMSEVTYRELPGCCKFSAEVIIQYSDQIVLHGYDINSSMYSDYFRTHGLVIGTHKFNAMYSVERFDYNLYAEYLRSTYYWGENPPVCYANKKNPYCFYLLDEPETIVEIDWFLYPVQQLWQKFKEVLVLYSNLMFRRADYVARQIETGISYCLSFGQFAQVLPFLPHMKFSKELGSSNFRPKRPKKWNNLIHNAIMVCHTNYSEEQMRRSRRKTESKGLRNRTLLNTDCPVKYDVTIDLLHGVVFIKKLEEHSSECHSIQQQKGYLITRRLKTEKNIRDRFDRDLLDYYGIDKIIMKNHDRFFKGVEHVSKRQRTS